MLLNEIMSKEIPGLRQSKKELDRGNDPLNKKKWNKLGGGLQSRAYSPTNTNNAVKLVNIAGTKDPSYQFIRMCSKHQDNPYFPKIFKVTKYPLAAGLSKKVLNTDKLVVTMERLERFISSDIIKVEQAFGIRFGNFIKNMTDEEASRYLQTKLFKDPTWRAGVIKTTKDPHLKQAMRLLEPLFRHYQPDMHFGNIMMRGIGENRHMVFIDPTM